MNLQIIQGQFTSNEAIDLLTEMVAVKIKFHEKQINGENNFEDTKMRENRIKKLQNDLALAKTELQNRTDKIALTCQINFS